MNGEEGRAAGGTEGERVAVPAFREYGLAELRAATNDFSSKLIVSESGEKAPNVVYRGRLDASRVVAVKRFSKQAWPDAQQFVVSTLPRSLFLSFPHQDPTHSMISSL